jgi:arylsulfatase
MVEHDGHVGQMLDKLKELGLEDNTIVMYSTDNGAETMSWPDGGTTMFRGEKNTQWEGGFRVPCAIRWPGVIKPGTIINEIATHEDMLTTLLAAAGEPDGKDKLLKGHKAIGRDYKVYLDGYNLLPALKGEAAWPRNDFIYWTDDGNVAALRFKQWKISFLRQDAHGLAVWSTPFLPLRVPMLCNLRADPLERAEYEGMDYNRWFVEHAFGRWLQSFREFPPRQKPGTFNLDHVMEQVTKAHGQ